MFLSTPRTLSSSHGSVCCRKRFAARYMSKFSPAARHKLTTSNATQRVCCRKCFSARCMSKKTTNDKRQTTKTNDKRHPKPFLRAVTSQALLEIVDGPWGRIKRDCRVIRVPPYVPVLTRRLVRDTGTGTLLKHMRHFTLPVPHTVPFAAVAECGNDVADETLQAVCQPVVFRFTEVFHHIGDTRDYGHYIARTKYASEWQECDDRNIRPHRTQECINVQIHMPRHILHYTLVPDATNRSGLLARSLLRGSRRHFGLRPVWQATQVLKRGLYF